LANLDFSDLHSFLTKKLDDHTFITLNCNKGLRLKKVIAKEPKDNLRLIRYIVHFVYYDFGSSRDESSDAYAGKFVWSSKAKSYSCDSINPVHISYLSFR
jgi:hypothetical protein